MFIVYGHVSGSVLSECMEVCDVFSWPCLLSSWCICHKCLCGIFPTARFHVGCAPRRRAVYLYPHFIHGPRNTLSLSLVYIWFTYNNTRYHHYQYQLVLNSLRLTPYSAPLMFFTVNFHMHIHLLTGNCICACVFSCPVFTSGIAFVLFFRLIIGSFVSCVGSQIIFILSNVSHPNLFDFLFLTFFLFIM